MREVGAAGFIVFRESPRSFLLMRHRDRWDLPKGHLDEGEDELAGALRELEEETGFSRAELEVDPQFRFVTQYEARYARFGEETVHKTVTLFLAVLKISKDPVLTEHVGFEWFAWAPPHRIQSFTIDPLLEAVARHFERR